MSQRDRVSPGGQAIGAKLARLADAAIAKQRRQFPKMKERCVTCAFRLGTIPNGCIQTQADAVKALMEGVPFMCHHSVDEKELCAGWFALYSEKSMNGAPRFECPWPFSPPDK